jgi:hypothetical protein
MVVKVKTFELLLTKVLIRTVQFQPETLLDVVSF